MSKTIAPLLLATLLSLGCSPRDRTDPGEDDPGVDMKSQCRTGETRCNGSVFQTCENGVLKNKTTCTAPKLCSTTMGCVDCLPDSQTCVGDEVRACTAGGIPGDLVDTCAPGGCLAGKCLDNCKAGEFVYVVDEQYNLHGFNPKDNTFKLIGRLNCPAGPSWPAWGGLGPATPFSMSVDREAKAWVLYTSGEIFRVDTKDAACTKSAFQPGQKGLELFGMGFVSNARGSREETLFVAGGAAGSVEDGILARIDPKSLVLDRVGNLTVGEYGPELTGTGNGEFYGYFPGMTRSYVAQIDKATAQNMKEWPLKPLNGLARAWAFAHWGGRFYIFITVQDFAGQNLSQVHLFDPKDGSVNVILPSIQHVIVGAGVSTCAPVVVE